MAPIGPTPYEMPFPLAKASKPTGLFASGNLENVFWNPLEPAVEHCGDGHWSQGGSEWESKEGKRGQGCLITERRDEENLVLHMRAVAMRQYWILSPKPGHFLDVDQLMKDLSLVMMGIESHTFPLEEGRFVLRPRLTLLNVSPEVFSSLCTAFISCGNLTKSLHEVTFNGDSATDSKSKILSGFFRGINSFLRLHSLAVSEVHRSNPTLLAFVGASRPLIEHTAFVASICNAFNIPKGVALIQHVLVETRSVVRTDISLIALSILRATVDPYLRFLASWLFEGRGYDDEFGIRSDATALSARDVDFWTRGFSSDTSEDHFDLNDRILGCGKALNLLRLCRSDHPLCCSALRELPAMRLAFSPEQEEPLKADFEEYGRKIQRFVEIRDVKHAESRVRDRAKAETSVRMRPGKTSRRGAAVESGSAKRAAAKDAKTRRSGFVEVAPKIGSKPDAVEKLMKSHVKQQMEEEHRIERVKDDLERFYAGARDDDEVEALTKGMHERVEVQEFRGSVRDETTGSSEGIVDNRAKGEKSDSTEEITDAGAKKRVAENGDVEERIEREGVEGQLARCEAGNGHDDENKGSIRPEAKADRAKRATLQPMLSKETLEDSAVVFKVPKAVGSSSSSSRAPHSLGKVKPVDETVRIACAEIPRYSLPLVDDGSRLANQEESSSGRSRSKSSFASLEQMVRQSIEIPLAAQLRLVNEAVMRHLIEEADFWAHLNAVRNYVLLDDAEFAHNLCRELVEVERSDRGISAANPAVLGHLLRRAVSSSSRASRDDLASRLGFTLTNGETDDGQHLGLTLSFQVVWPLNIIVTQEHMDSFRRAFRLLLKVEKTHHLLQETFLLFRQKKHLAHLSRYRELQLIRHQMLSYMITLRSYLRCQVLERCWNQFKADVGRLAACVDTLRAVHAFHVDKLESRLFQKKETLAIASTIDRTLDAITSFCTDSLSANSWRQDDVGDVLVARARRASQSFKACLNFFISVVSKLDVRGHKHHVQELLICLRSASCLSNDRK